MSSEAKAQAASAASDDEDDYMNMSFSEAPQVKPETSLQRREREKREGAIRGMVKSKAQLAAEEIEAREKALSRSMLEDAAAKKSKGLAMMAKMGFKGGALGSKENTEGRTEPIRVEIKEDRGGIGVDSEKKRKLQEVVEQELKKPKLDPLEYRDRIRKERETERMEKQVYSAQRLAEQMDEEKTTTITLEQATKTEKGKPRTISSRPLKSINVLWRGLIRHREEKERDRRMRHDLEQSLSRLPTYEDDNEDEDDRKALGKHLTSYVTAEDLDDEDPELDEFNELEVEEKLWRLLEHLRTEYHYCFWCKYTYPNAEMEGCPGLTEEDHD